MYAGVKYEVLRPLYTSSSEPQLIDVSFEQVQTRTGAPHAVLLYCDSRRTQRTLYLVHINYDILHVGSATSNATVTGV